MATLRANLRLPLIASTALVLPFLVLELVNRQAFHEDFPFVLFGLMWLLALAFVLILMPIVQNVRAGSRIMQNPLNLLVRIALMSLIAWL